jgi:hypothetical protein
MAQINMKEEVKKDTVNSAEIKKSEAVAQAEPNNKSAKLIDNAPEKAEDINKTDKQATKEKGNKGKVVVIYIGNGIWKDSEGELWAPDKKTANIINERQYTADEYEVREDLKFMVKYGSMKATHVK